MTRRTLDREMLDCYLTILEAYDPEAADQIEAVYETRAATDEEIAAILIEELAKHDVEVDQL
jgi:hypothetical protein